MRLLDRFVTFIYRIVRTLGLILMTGTLLTIALNFVSKCEAYDYRSGSFCYIGGFNITRLIEFLSLSLFGILLTVIIISVLSLPFILFEALLSRILKERQTDV